LSSFAPPIQRLVTELSKLPGIGSRTAQRLAFHILRASDEDALGLAEAIKEVKEKVGLCEVCFNLADEARCRICQDSRRDASMICVVEEPSDVIPMERTHEFNGLYHVLGGALSPIDGVEPEDLKIEELYARVMGNEGDRIGVADGQDMADVDGQGMADVDGQDMAGTHGQDMAGTHGQDMAGTHGQGMAGTDGQGTPFVRAQEVVLATNPTTTGEATALHIAEELRHRAPDLKVTRLASGLPVGSDLEYADEVTLGKALAGRRSL
jgi:recombination protein RecR